MRSVMLVWMPLAALGFVGCRAALTPDDDRDAFGILVSPGFVATERSGETIAATDQGGSSCRSTSQSADLLTQDAFYSATPDHRLSLAQPIAGLTVRVVSESEVVLWIRYRQNNFCNLSGSNEIVRGSWSAGDYDIFIGSPTQGAAISYVLEIIE